MTAKTESAGRERTATRRPDRDSPQAETVGQLAQADPVAREGEDAKAALPSTESAQQADPTRQVVWYGIATPAGSAGSKSARDPGRRHAKGHGSLLVSTAGCWLGLNALINLVFGFGALGSQRVAHDSYMFGILHSSGWIAIVLGILQLVVAVMALTGDQLARWLGVALLVLNVIDQQFFIGTYPLWSALIILFDMLAVYALCRYGSRKNLAALDFPIGGIRA